MNNIWKTKVSNAVLIYVSYDMYPISVYYENKLSIMTMSSLYIVYIYKLYSMDFVW